MILSSLKKYVFGIFLICLVSCNVQGMQKGLPFSFMPCLPIAFTPPSPYTKVSKWELAKNITLGIGSNYVFSYALNTLAPTLMHSNPLIIGGATFVVAPVLSKIAESGWMQKHPKIQCLCSLGSSLSSFTGKFLINSCLLRLIPQHLMDSIGSHVFSRCQTMATDSTCSAVADKTITALTQTAPLGLQQAESSLMHWVKKRLGFKATLEDAPVRIPKSAFQLPARKANQTPDESTEPKEKPLEWALKKKDGYEKSFIFGVISPSAIKNFFTQNGIDLEKEWNKLIPQDQQAHACKTSKEEWLLFCEQRLETLRKKIDTVFEQMQKKLTQLPTEIQSTLITDFCQKIGLNQSSNDFPFSTALNTPAGLIQEFEYTPKNLLGALQQAIKAYLEKQYISHRFDAGDESIFNMPYMAASFLVNTEKKRIAAFSYPQCSQDELFPHQQWVPMQPRYLHTLSFLMSLAPFIPCFLALSTQTKIIFLHDGSYCKKVGDQFVCPLHDFKNTVLEVPTNCSSMSTCFSDVNEKITWFLERLKKQSLGTYTGEDLREDSTITTSVTCSIEYFPYVEFEGHPNEQLSCLIHQGPHTAILVIAKQQEMVPVKSPPEISTQKTTVETTDEPQVNSYPRIAPRIPMERGNTTFQATSMTYLNDGNRWPTTVGFEWKSPSDRLKPIADTDRKIIKIELTPGTCRENPEATKSDKVVIVLS